MSIDHPNCIFGGLLVYLLPMLSVEVIVLSLIRESLLNIPKVINILSLCFKFVYGDFYLLKACNLECRVIIVLI